jgi:Zn-dependent peptidase ImmA (M78 family)/transcriptional regulator with XRE-family HTH domain
MTRAKALINKETLVHICSHIGVTTAFLAQRTNIAADSIAKWLSLDDATVPTINQAKTLAKALRVPFAGLYMSKDSINFKHLPNLRNLRTLPDGVVIDDSALNLAIIDLVRARDFLYSSESELGLVNALLSLPVIPESATPTEYAKTIRAFLGLELDAQFKSTSARQFYLYVREQVESKGIFIHCFTGVEVEAVRGIAIFDEASPIIGINDDDRYPAKTLSIIHELVHVLKRQSTLCNDMYSSFSLQGEEVFCNAVAGEALVPAASLDAYLNAHKLSSISLNDIKTMSERFSVSKEVITRRLFDTSHFSKDEYDTFTNEIRQPFEQEREAAKIARMEGRGQSIPRNVSREAVDKNSAAICRVLLIGYGEGFFSKQDLSGLLGIKEKHIQKFIAEVAKW